MIMLTIINSFIIISTLMGSDAAPTLVALRWRGVKSSDVIDLSHFGIAHLAKLVVTLSYTRTHIRTHSRLHSYLTNGLGVRTSVSYLLTESLWHSFDCSKCLGYWLSLAGAKGTWRLTEVWGCSAFSLVREYCTLYCMCLNCSWLWCVIYHRKKKQKRSFWYGFHV